MISLTMVSLNPLSLTHIDSYHSLTLTHIIDSPPSLPPLVLFEDVVYQVADFALLQLTYLYLVALLLPVPVIDLAAK